MPDEERAVRAGGCAIWSKKNDNNDVERAVGDPESNEFMRNDLEV